MARVRYAILSWKCYIKTQEKQPITTPSSFLDESMRMLLQEYFHRKAFPQSKLLQYFSPILLKGVKQIVFRRGMTKILLRLHTTMGWNQFWTWNFFMSLCLKFIYSEKAKKFCKISTLLLSVCTVDKIKVEIWQNFVHVSEYTNFKLASIGLTKTLELWAAYKVIPYSIIT